MDSEIISTGHAHAHGDIAELLHSAAETAEDWDAASETRELVVDIQEHGTRIDKWLASRCPEFSRAYFQQLLDQACVKIDGTPVLKASTKVKAGSRAAVELRPTAQAQAFLPEAIPLEVLFEDEHLMVLNKPAGLVVHPAAGNWTGTLLNALLAYHTGASRLPRAGIVHRLDKDTSGVMVVANTTQATDALVRMIAARQLHRIYLALAHGAWEAPSETLIDQPIGRDPRNRLRMAVLPTHSTGAKVAQTSVRCLDSNPQWSWLGCKLHTGRTHQIRVHLAWSGHPLAADATYGGKPLGSLKRQALHAFRLVFQHPITQERVDVQAPIPQDLEKALMESGLQYNLHQLWQIDNA